MKKLVIAIFVACVFAASSYAAGPTQTKIYKTSNTVTADTAVTIFGGAGRLFKIQVSSPGVSSGMVIYDSKDSANQAKIIAGIDTTSAGEYEYDVYISSGLTYDNYGTDPASVSIIYKKDDTFDTWISSFSNVAATENLISAGSGVLHKVIIASATAGGVALNIYDAQAGTAQGDLIAQVEGSATRDLTFDVHISSGLRYEQVGTGGFTIIFKRVSP